MAGFMGINGGDAGDSYMDAPDLSPLAKLKGEKSDPGAGWNPVSAFIDLFRQHVKEAPTGGTVVPPNPDQMPGKTSIQPITNQGSFTELDSLKLPEIPKF